MILISILCICLVFNCNTDAVNLISVPQLIRAEGYPVETHVVDSGGYLLTVHRLPQPPSRPAATSVMVVHGLFCSSVDWIMHGRGRALGYLLYDAGLDVWLPNLRGSTNSLRHKTWKTSQNEFWNYTFEEMGTEDIFIMTDYILKLTGNEKIHFISNSMGGTSMLAGLSEKPEYNNKYHQLIMYGPHTNMNNTSGSVRILSTLEPQMQRMSRSLNIFKIPPNSGGMFNFLYDVCAKQDYEVNICTAIHNMFIGNGALMEFPLFVKFVKYYPTATSVKCLLHIFQTMGRDKFARFDYGKNKNSKIYGTPYPKSYNLSKVTAPVFLVHAKRDNLVPPEDIELLKTQLPNVIGTLYVTQDDFRHSSFLWHPNISEIAYKRIVSSVSNFIDNNLPNK